MPHVCHLYLSGGGFFRVFPERKWREGKNDGRGKGTRESLSTWEEAWKKGINRRLDLLGINFIHLLISLWDDCGHPGSPLWKTASKKRILLPLSFSPCILDFSVFYRSSHFPVTHYKCILERVWGCVLGFPCVFSSRTKLPKMFYVQLDIPL